MKNKFSRRDVLAKGTVAMGTDPSFKARRWVVEACHSWFNRFRKLTIRYEKLGATHLALIPLAAAIIALRKIKTKIVYG